MDNIEQAKKWFRDLFQGCYTKRLDNYPDSIFWIYDKNLIRQIKLSKITGIEKYNLDMSAGEVIFEQDEKYKKFWIEYWNYWSFLETEFNLNHDEIKELTSSVVNEVLNCNQYTTNCFFKLAKDLVNEVLNCNQYTIHLGFSGKIQRVNEVLNCK